MPSIFGRLAAAALGVVVSGAAANAQTFDMVQNPQAQHDTLACTDDDGSFPCLDQPINHFIRQGSFRNNVVPVLDFDDTFCCSGGWRAAKMAMGGLDNRLNRGQDYPGIGSVVFSISEALTAPSHSRGKDQSVSDSPDDDCTCSESKGTGMKVKVSASKKGSDAAPCPSCVAAAQAGLKAAATPTSANEPFPKFPPSAVLMSARPTIVRDHAMYLHADSGLTRGALQMQRFPPRQFSSVCPRMPWGASGDVSSSEIISSENTGSKSKSVPGHSLLLVPSPVKRFNLAYENQVNLSNVITKVISQEFGEHKLETFYQLLQLQSPVSYYFKQLEETRKLHIDKATTYVFFGDSGQKDLETAIASSILSPDRFTAAFVHLVHLKNENPQQHDMDAFETARTWSAPGDPSKLMQKVRRFGYRAPSGTMLDALHFSYEVVVTDEEYTSPSCKELSSKLAYNASVLVGRIIRGAQFRFAHRINTSTSNSTHSFPESNLPMPIVFARCSRVVRASQAPSSDGSEIFKSNSDTAAKSSSWSSMLSHFKSPASFMTVRICDSNKFTYFRTENEIRNAHQNLAQSSVLPARLAHMAGRPTPSLLGTPFVSHRTSIGAAVGAYAQGMITPARLGKIILATVRETRSLGPTQDGSYAEYWASLHKDICAARFVLGGDAEGGPLPAFTDAFNLPGLHDAVRVAALYGTTRRSRVERTFINHKECTNDILSAFSSFQENQTHTGGPHALSDNEKKAALIIVRGASNISCTFQHNLQHLLSIGASELEFFVRKIAQLGRSAMLAISTGNVSGTMSNADSAVAFDFAVSDVKLAVETLENAYWQNEHNASTLDGGVGKADDLADGIGPSLLKNDGQPREGKLILSNLQPISKAPSTKDSLTRILKTICAHFADHDACGVISRMFNQSRALTDDEPAVVPSAGEAGTSVDGSFKEKQDKEQQQHELKNLMAQQDREKTLKQQRLIDDLVAFTEWKNNPQFEETNLFLPFLQILIGNNAANSAQYLKVHQHGVLRYGPVMTALLDKRSSHTIWDGIMKKSEDDRHIWKLGQGILLALHQVLRT
eukprot:GHVT01009502.1.p1 GENE.GHVT01009502.1~~GHVT01009502.1.p1  ORF type:complete len:1065 (+),score=93.82 GHVT01009502.1:170-3364(+)